MMCRRQTSIQHRFTELQPSARTLRDYKSQKSRLEILGSLFFCVGFTFCKPAWSAPEVSSMVLSDSPIDHQQNVVVTDTSTETAALPSPSPPAVVPPEGGMETKDKRTWEPQDSPKEDVRSVTELFAASPNGGIAASKEASLHFSSIQVEPFNSSQSSSPLILKGVTAFSDTQSPISCSIAQQQTSTLEDQSHCSPPPPTLLTQLEQGSPSEVLPLPPENPSQTQPGLGEDPELGILRLRELPVPPPPSQPAVYLLGGAGYFRSNNIFSGVDPVDDGLFRTGLTLLAVPSIGPQTSLFASVGGNIFRYSDLSEYDYNELRFNAGIRQQIGNRSYGELGWNNRQLFSKDGGDRFLNDHSAYLELGRRDLLAERLTLDTYYQLRLSFANPSDRSQVINSVGASLGYNLSPSLLLALDYQFAFADFTQQEREDQYHQLLARMNYTLSPNSRLYLFGGKSFGSSSDSNINFDGLVFGLGVDFSLTLF